MKGCCPSQEYPILNARTRCIYKVDALPFHAGESPLQRSACHHCKDNSFIVDSVGTRMCFVVLSYSPELYKTFLAFDQGSDIVPHDV